jgi:hypothetical protein
MTSQQLRTRLASAVDIIALCERVLEDPNKAQRRGIAEDARHAVFHFMDLYRQELADGGQP